MKRVVLTLASSLATTPALAHLGPEEHGSFLAGVSHPVFGADHILAMVAVGLWAALIAAHRGTPRGMALWVLPCAFVGAMGVGYLAALSGMSLPLVEPMILLSVILLGAAIAMALRLPITAAAGIVGLFGLFHGHAHGFELGSAGAFAFGAGFAVSTALLHGLGIAAALPLTRAVMGSKLLKGLGWVTTAGGLWIAFGG